MKIKKEKIVKNSKLIRLHMLKSKIYKKNKLFNMQWTELQAKKSAEILYKFCINDQRILFLGFPRSFESSIYKTRHIMLTGSSWLNGLISNQVLRYGYRLTEEQKRFPSKTLKLLLSLKKKVDLIVVFNIDNNINAVNEGHIARIPVIGGFSSEVPENLDFTGKISYKIPGHFVSFDERNKSSNFFVSLVKTVLKKSVINYSKESVLKYSKWVTNVTKKRKKWWRKKKFHQGRYKKKGGRSSYKILP